MKRKISRIKKKILFGIIMQMFLTACSNSVDNVYIISKNDSLSKVYLGDSVVVIAPPKVKYAAYTFIIDSTDNFYFYSMPEERPSIGVFDDDEPDYINLQPNRVFSIPTGSEQKFFEKNVLYQKSSRSTKTIMIASYKDTINSEFLKYLIELSKVKENKTSITVRLVLPEEREVVKFKINGRYYDPKF